MIAYLRGTVIHLDVKRLVLNVGNIGYEIWPSASVLGSGAHTGDELAIHTFLNVKEDKLELYGFTSLAEKDMFTQLITVSGVGPKLGLALISALGPDKLSRAIMSGDEDTIKSISGVGAKSAKRLILELRSKLGNDAVSLATVANDSFSEALAGLTALGFPPAEASEAIEQARRHTSAGSRPDLPESESTPELIKQALSILRSNAK